MKKNEDNTVDLKEFIREQYFIINEKLAKADEMSGFGPTREEAIELRGKAYGVRLVLMELEYLLGIRDNFGDLIK